MVGQRNSVLSRVKLKQPNVFSLGCLCHLAALCAVSGLKKLPVSIDNLLIDIFYHFKHSPQRWSEFAEIQKDFDEIAPLKVLKHCSTRWLSLERCVKRLIYQWQPILTYFDRESGYTSNERVQRVFRHLSSIETKLFCHFVLYALKPLNNFSLSFQTNANKIAFIQSDVRKLLKVYLSNFIHPNILQAIDDVIQVDYMNRSCQLGDNELGIGTSTRMLLCEPDFADEFIGTTIGKRFYTSVRLFYECSVTILR